MTTLIVSLILIGLGIIAMLFFLYGKLTNYSLRVTVIKGIASLLFVALSLFLFISKGYPTLGIFLVIGGFFGMVGDVLLGLKRTYTEKKHLLNYGGFFCFALGHIIYIVGMFICFYINGYPLAVVFPFVGAIAVAGIIVLFQKQLNLDFGKDSGATFIYIVLVTLMFSSAFSLLVIHGFNYNPLIVFSVGGFCFMVSDLLLCKSYFGKYSKMESAIYTFLYYAGQFLIAFSLFFL